MDDDYLQGVDPDETRQWFIGGTRSICGSAEVMLGCLLCAYENMVTLNSV